MAAGGELGVFPIGASWIRRGSTNLRRAPVDIISRDYHVVPECAKRESPVPGGDSARLLTLSLIGSLSQEIGVVPSDAAGGSVRARQGSLCPVPAGSRVRLRVARQRRREREGNVVLKTKNVLEIENSEKPALMAEALALMISARKAN